MVVPSVIAPDVVWIELVVDADAQDLVGDAGIEGSGPRIRGRRCDGEDRAKGAPNQRPLPTRLALKWHAIGCSFRGWPRSFGSNLVLTRMDNVTL
jgi:hypothetical protein